MLIETESKDCEVSFGHHIDELVIVTYSAYDPGRCLIESPPVEAIPGRVFLRGVRLVEELVA